MQWGRHTLGVLLTQLLACSNAGHPAAFGVDVDSDADTASDASIDTAIGADVLSPCGDDVIPILIDAPNLYFVLDGSGSMGATLPGASLSKHEAARVAIARLLEQIGHRVNYGAAVFPDETAECSAGVQVFATQPGDPFDPELDAPRPLLKALLNSLARRSPAGATTIASTLAALHPALMSLVGQTAVVLATDGAPNCGSAPSCDADGCILNIEGASVDGKDCTLSYNCCDATLTGDANAAHNCMDELGTLSAIQALADANISTYVVGIPGSETYAELLERMARAGGTARAQPPFYYATSDSADLTDALAEIGAQVSRGCSLTLSSEPEDPGLLNVYLDATLLPRNSEHGWTFQGEKSLELHGAACLQVSRGDVRDVHVVFGCPTDVE